VRRDRGRILGGQVLAPFACQPLAQRDKLGRGEGKRGSATERLPTGRQE
jgi:hypothetical protein